MSEINDVSPGNEEVSADELDKFLEALQSMMRRFPSLMRDVEVLVGLRESNVFAESSANSALRSKLQCNPPCPPGKRCYLRPGPSLERICK